MFYIYSKDSSSPNDVIEYAIIEALGSASANMIAKYFIIGDNWKAHNDNYRTLSELFEKCASFINQHNFVFYPLEHEDDLR